MPALAENALKVLRKMVGLGLVCAWFIQDMRAAAPQEAGVAGIAMRGPGARVRARLDRVRLAVEANADGVLLEIDEILTDIRGRRGALEAPFDLDTREALAREALGLRNQHVLGTVSAPRGFQQDFIVAVAGGAAWSDWAQGVPASITLAQAILESNWGRSAPGFNLFGMKGEGTAGSQRRRVVEYRNGRRRVKMADFRAYSSFDEGLVDHASILATGRRYARARAVSEDVPAYAAALQGTYATDPRYASKLTGLVARYRLDRFDWNPRSPWL